MFDDDTSKYSLPDEQMKSFANTFGISCERCMHSLAVGENKISCNISKIIVPVERTHFCKSWVIYKLKGKSISGDIK